MTVGSDVEVLSRDECLRLLASQQIGRLAVVVDGRPHVVPVNYVLDGEDLVVRSGEGTKLSASRRETVAFEVDEIDLTTQSGWSVVVNGQAEEITSFHGALFWHMRALPLAPWADPEDKLHWVRIVPFSITGRRVRGG